MAETSANKHKWIVDKKPSVLEVIKKFPTLKTFDMVCTLLVSYIQLCIAAFGGFCIHYRYGGPYEEFYGQLEDLDSQNLPKSQIGGWIAQENVFVFSPFNITIRR